MDNRALAAFLLGEKDQTPHRLERDDTTFEAGPPSTSLWQRVAARLGDGLHAYMSGNLNNSTLSPYSFLESADQARTSLPRVYRGEMTTEQMVPEALNFAGTAMTGAMPFARPANSVGTFAGRRAKTADHDALQRAEALEKQGHSRNDIRQGTGWFKDAGGNWRYEIPDNAATVLDGEASTLGGRLQHSELYQAYPELKSLPVRTLGSAPGALGAYVPRDNAFLSKIKSALSGQTSAEMRLPPKPTRGTVIHEAQHAIDDIEGALVGLDRKNPYGTQGPPRAGDPSYSGQPFEKTAQAASARSDMGRAELNNRAPWLDYNAKPRAIANQPPPAGPSSGPSIMPERQALDDALAGVGLSNHDGKFTPWIDGMEGRHNSADTNPHLTNSIEDMALGRGIYAGSKISQDPRWRALGEALSAYRGKAQRLGHNGGPAMSEWVDPVLYSNPSTSAIAALLLGQEGQ